MRNLRVALAQTAPRLGDVAANLAVHLDVIRQAREQSADLVIFPELSLTGYRLMDQVPDVALSVVEAGAIERSAGDPLEELRRASAEIDIVAGFVEEAPGHRFHNAAAYFSRGRVAHLHRKLFLPTYGMFQEGRDFAPGERLRAFETRHGSFGMLICEDLWHPTCSWLLAQDGVETIVVLSNGPTRGATPDGEITGIAVWHELARVTARFQTAFVLYVNRVGCESGLTFGGGSIVVDPAGDVIAEAPALEESLSIVDLDAEALRRARTTYPLLRDENLELVRRELDRIRRRRYGLRDAGAPGATGGPEEGEVR